MSEPTLRIRARNLPHWTLEGSTYFVTFRLFRGQLSGRERHVVLDHIVSGRESFYDLPAAIIMPDHVHLLVRPRGKYDLPRIMKGIKGASSRKINVLRKSRGTLWQDESQDRIIRDMIEFEQKLNYMANNPVKAGLAQSIEEYPYWYCDKRCL